MEESEELYLAQIYPNVAQKLITVKVTMEKNMLFSEITINVVIKAFS